MYQFFTRKTREMSHLLVDFIDFGSLAVIGFFAGKKELQTQREKKALEQANPGKKVIIKAHPGRFGTVWSWSLAEENVELPTPLDKAAPPLQQGNETSQNTTLDLKMLFKPSSTETKDKIESPEPLQPQPRK